MIYLRHPNDLSKHSVEVTLNLIMNEKEVRNWYMKKHISLRSLDFLPDSFDIESQPFSLESKLVYYFKSKEVKSEIAGEGYSKFPIARHYAQEICPSFITSCLF